MSEFLTPNISHANRISKILAQPSPNPIEQVLTENEIETFGLDHLDQTPPPPAKTLENSKLNKSELSRLLNNLDYQTAGEELLDNLNVFEPTESRPEPRPEDFTAALSYELSDNKVRLNEKGEIEIDVYSGNPESYRDSPELMLGQIQLTSEEFYQLLKNNQIVSKENIDIPPIAVIAGATGSLLLLAKGRKLLSSPANEVFDDKKSILHSSGKALEIFGRSTSRNNIKKPEKPFRYGSVAEEAFAAVAKRQAVADDEERQKVLQAEQKDRLKEAVETERIKRLENNPAAQLLEFYGLSLDSKSRKVKKIVGHVRSGKITLEEARQQLRSLQR